MRVNLIGYRQCDKKTGLLRINQLGSSLSHHVEAGPALPVIPP
jgi:hypothetical protein